MFSSFLQGEYWYMFIQVIVTMVIIPFYAYTQMTKTLRAQCDAHSTSAKSDMNKYLQSARSIIFAISFICFLVGMVIVGKAFYSQSELFNWDNQAGLIVLFLLAMIPVVSLIFLQKRAFALIKEHAGSIRSASLKAENWKDYFSLPILGLIALGQVLFIYTVFYFVQHPFDGFAGYSNLIGLTVLDSIFVALFFVLYKNRRFSGVKSTEQRRAIKRKAIQLNSLIWMIAVFHLSLSMWVSSLNNEALELPLQSFYLQVVIFLTIFTLALPRPLLGERS